MTAEKICGFFIFLAKSACGDIRTARHSRFFVYNSSAFLV